MNYHISIQQYRPLAYDCSWETIWSGFIESDKTKEEIEKEIIEHNKKQGRNIKVTVNLSPLNVNQKGEKKQ